MSGVISLHPPEAFAVLTGNTLPFCLLYTSIQPIKLYVLNILIFYVWDASW